MSPAKRFWLNGLQPVARCLSLATLGMACAIPGLGAEKFFDFNSYPADKPVPGFVTMVTGGGGPGEWKILRDELPSLLAPLTPGAAGTNKRGVLAQVSRVEVDERFPIFVYNEEKFGDFELHAQLKLVDGKLERMGGIAFRIVDEKNYYVVRASSLGNTLKFYKFVDGVRSAPIGPELPVPSGVWNTLVIECKGNTIRCQFNGKEPFPALSDNSFAVGRIGFWTKSDSVTYFGDLKITYTPLEILARKIVRGLIDRYPRVLELDLYGTSPENPTLRVLASSKEASIGTPGKEIEMDVIKQDRIGFGRTTTENIVTVPIHDRNGEAVAALRVVLKPFPGQTEQNAIARALPLAQMVERQIRTGHDLTQE